MDPLKKMTRETILKIETIKEAYDIKDEVERARMIAELSLRAGELRCKTEFKNLANTYKRVSEKQKQKEENKNATYIQFWTNFGEDCPYDRMLCQPWTATEGGIRKELPDGTELMACYHPIIPVKRLRNLETGEEQIEIAFKRNGVWNSKIVPKTLIASANKIVSLAAWGVSVTSENAKYLVRYLSDVENLNEKDIEVRYSTSKLGWIKNDFIPYDKDIMFDGNSRFRQIYEAVDTHGSRVAWYDHVKQLRKTGRIEIKFLMAASFASVLLPIVSALPFITDLYGFTEGGKTVTLMLATSIWGDPGENHYIGDFKTTDVALEARADMLNNLPMVLDDTSKTSARIRDNFEGIVYDLCSGKGKSRSNKELGINRENHWQNSILTNGERPLSEYVSQGGAINRILEIECGEKVFKDPQHTADLVRNSYGFAGQDFVKAIREIGFDQVREMQRDFQKQLMRDDKMQKQAISLSVVLTADKIATQYLFKDGENISIKEAADILIDKDELSDNERAYRFICDKVRMNFQRFDKDAKIEQWGFLESGYAKLYPQALGQLAREGSFSTKTFLPWAKKKGLLAIGNNGFQKQKKIGGTPVWLYWLKITDEKNDPESQKSLDFTQDLYKQEEIPFT